MLGWQVATKAPSCCTALLSYPGIRQPIAYLTSRFANVQFAFPLGRLSPKCYGVTSCMTRLVAGIVCILGIVM